LALCLGATGPIYAGYMLNAGYSWRLFFWVCLAFAGALLIAAFIFVEESTYKRPVILVTPEREYVKEDIAHIPEIGMPTRKSWGNQLSLWNGVNHDVSFWLTMFRPFTYLFVPAVFWVIATYGIVIN
jgi:MFS family permease